jgi:hypothetical protein
VPGLFGMARLERELSPLFDGHPGGCAHRGRPELLPP